MGYGEDGLMGEERRDVAPVWRLCIGAGTALLSVVLQMSGTDMAHLVGWALGSLATISFVGAYRAGDLRASTSPWYSPRPELERLAILVLASGFASAVLHAWFYSQGRGL